MPFALVTIGVLLLFTALNRTAGAFGTQIYKDLFSEDGGFVYWAAGIVIVGLIGYIPAFKKPADAFIVLIILAMLLKNGDFFSKLQSGLAGGAGATSGSTASNLISGAQNLVTNNPLLNGGLTGGMTSELASAGIGSGPLGTTTPAPGTGSGGIGAA